ncbi:MAG: GspMb/PilO family protein [Gammaproteobacteria bacterium]
MTKREKNIVMLAGLVGIVFVLTQGLPSLKNMYGSRSEAISQLQTDIQREQSLIEDAQLWSERRVEAELRGSDLGERLFQETSIPLISANIQRLVREYANEAEVNITSTKLAESMAADGWLLVEQELSILTDSQTKIMALLNSIETSDPLLGVSTFSIRRNRNQYTGTITVVGFSRTNNTSGAAD